ncbi:MAG: alpha/beta hydrolase-fold protein [Phototrophicaceae bacterium]
MLKQSSYLNILFVILMGLLAACEPFAYNPTPVTVLITVPATETLTPTPTVTPSITPTPAPTETPFIPTATPFPCDEDQGQFIDIDDNESENGRGENLRYRLYLPPCYQSTSKRFPIVYLLHGLSYREEQWEDLGIHTALDQGIRAGALPPMILVMPYLGQLGQFNQFPPDPSYELFVVDELVPDVERSICTIENSDHRAIGGISRGGFLAYSIAMRNPDLFGIVGGHSAYFPINTNDIPPAFNPIELALNESFLQQINLRMWLDNGAGDSSASSQQLFSARLTQRNVEHTYVVHPTGEHNNDYWSAHIAEYLTFYGREWERDYGQLPECAEPSP